MKHTKKTNENILHSKFYMIKERSRKSILNLGYDFIDFKRNLKRDLNRLKYRLPSITIYN
jgi:hypothetical protein